MTFPPNLGEVGKADGVVLGRGSSSLCPSHHLKGSLGIQLPQPGLQRLCASRSVPGFGGRLLWI